MDEDSPSKKFCSEESKEQDNSKLSFTPREYQIEILENAKKQNTIACLGTGTGKTFIAVMLIREMSHQVLIQYGEKKIFFLVPTVPLVHQQADVIRAHTELEVGRYYGEMSVDTWDQSDWSIEFKKNQVFVMTAEICRIILDHCFLPVSKICLLIFDECHQTRKNSPYHEVMRHISSQPSSEWPKIFGLSASLVNGKCAPSKFPKHIAELEYNMKSIITTASDYEEVQKYGTDPDEIVVLYENKTSIEDCPKLANLRKYSELLKLGEESGVSFFKKPSNCVNQLADMMQNLGPWFARCAAQMFCSETEKLLLHIKEDEIMEIISNVKHSLDAYINYLNQQNEKMNIQYCSHKLARLLEIFREMKSHCPTLQNSKDVQESPLCIIFVKQRIMAYVLCQWILEVSKQVPEFCYLKPDFIVGHGTTGQSNLSAMSVAKQKEVMKRFRERAFNILIATSVLEEGVDIQKCNVVIRFDVPENFRSYVQSKGRARAQGSKYIILLPAIDKAQFLEEMCTFKTIENLLMKTHNDKEDFEEEMDQDDINTLLPCYQPTTPAGRPRITMSSAIPIINRYCAKLPCDMTTKLTANWKIDVVDPDVVEKFYRCTLRMPINSPLRESVVGKEMRKKKYAKMAAALKACELLHQKGELDDHLLPTEASIEEEAESLGVQKEEVTDGGPKPGTKKRRQLYKKKIANVFARMNPSFSNAVFLYAIEMNLVCPLAKSLNPRKRPIVNPEESSRGFGLLVAERLPKIPKFPIFTKVGKICISLKCYDSPIYLISSQWKDIQKFHQFLFADSLQLKKESMQFSLERFPAVVVPINKSDPDNFYLDWTFVSHTLQHEYNVRKQKSFEELERTHFNEDLFEDSVVAKTYISSSEDKKFFFVNQIDPSLNIHKKIEKKKGLSFEEFYRDKYGIKIKNERQPMLKVEHSLSWDFTKPIYKTIHQLHEKLNKSQSKKRHEEFQIYLVPELCLLHPFKSSLFRKLTYLPTVLYRLNNLLLAEDIQSSIIPLQLPQEFEWPVFNFEKSDKALMDCLREKGEIIYEEKLLTLKPVDVVKINDSIISFHNVNVHEHLSPHPGHILQALTTTSAGEEYNLERLETIGDSFLKYVMSINIYVTFPGFNEGKLTQLRSRLISNSNLYNLAKKKGLGDSLVHTQFSVHHNWLPPCYKMDEDEKNDYLLQQMSDKCVADSVEALIGVYLLSCGQKGALRFMSWLGFNIEELTKTWPPTPTQGPILCEANNYQIQLKSHFDDFEAFQERIGYKFKEPAYLLQAFTHASYVYNEITDCYQRLEFLGDAILDYLITRHLFDYPKEHSPGEMTDLRSALVNNSYFASVAVKYGYNKNLKCLSLTLYKQIDAFISSLNTSKEWDYYLQEEECFNVEEVEVPKALGDVFESVAGAIYLDSGMSLDAVWNVYYPMMKPNIDHLSEHVPKQPVRELLEKVNGTKFSDVECEGYSCVRVTLPSGETFLGKGHNKRVAKLSAAKRALASLRDRKQKTS